MTQASTGTGYLKVDRAGATELVVPFHSIQAVVAGQGVILSKTVMTERRYHAEPQVALVEQTQPPRWYDWRPRRRR